jgi:single-strand DNA-binding protein
MNKVILVGNIGKDAECKRVGDGSVLTFSVATSEKWSDKSGQKQERTDWHRCELWGKRADALAQYITKGSRVAVTGSVHYREYEKDGTKRYSTEIRVDDIELLGGKRDGASEGAPRQRQAPQNDGMADDGIPF